MKLLNEIEMVFHVKNMVCNRCIKVVKEELEKAGLTVESIRLGEVAVLQGEKDVDMAFVRQLLVENGFELMDDKKALIIEKIKNTIIAQIHGNQSADFHINFSHLIEGAVGRDYQYLSNLFSSTEGITIEKYIILQRIEKAKELLIYDEVNLSEISYFLGYSSPQHLSSQFKKTTGLTPSEFRKLGNRHRKPLDLIGKKTD